MPCGREKVTGHFQMPQNKVMEVSKLFPSLRVQISTFKGKLHLLKQEPSPKKQMHNNLPQWSKLVFLVGEAGCMNSCKPRAAASILWLFIMYIGPQNPKLGIIRGESAQEPEGGAGRPTVHAPPRLQWVRLRSGSPLPSMAPHPTLGVWGGS